MKIANIDPFLFAGIGLMILFITAVIIVAPTLGPTYSKTKCMKYCNESYAGKSESGFMDTFVHTYKCDKSTLYENRLNGRCKDKDGYYQDCITYKCKKR